MIPISVIITTKHEEENIANCIKSIKQQTYPPANIEIIVVDNHSTDKTVEIAKGYTDLVYVTGPNRAARSEALSIVMVNSTVGQS